MKKATPMFPRWLRAWHWANAFLFLALDAVKRIYSVGYGLTSSGCFAEVERFGNGAEWALASWSWLHRRRGQCRRCDRCNLGLVIVLAHGKASHHNGLLQQPQEY